MRTSSNKSIFAASIGNFGEIYDFAVFGFSVPILATHFFPASDRTAAILSTFAVYAVAFFMRPVGGLMFGYLADRIGRIRVMSATVWLMAGGTALIGVLPTYASIGLLAPTLLVVCRCIQGLAMGGETTSNTTYTLESAPDDQRGRWIGLTWFWGFAPNAFAAVFLLALQLGVGAQAYGEWMWRVPFLLGGLVGLVGFWVRRTLDDPAEFVEASRKSHGSPLRSMARSSARSMLDVILLQPVLAVGSYILLAFMYSFLVRTGGLATTPALLTNAAGIMAIAVLLPISGRLSDRVGRKPVLRMGAACVAITAYPAVMLASSGSIAEALLGQILLGIGTGLYGGAAFTAMPELFPTAHRATGHAISYQLSVAIFGGLTPLLSSWLVVKLGTPLAPGYYAAAIGVAGFIAISFVPETRGTALRTSVQR